MKTSEYLAAVERAFTDALTDRGSQLGENICARLSEHGLLIVEVPAGIKHDFAGIAYVEVSNG